MVGATGPAWAWTRDVLGLNFGPGPMEEGTYIYDPTHPGDYQRINSVPANGMRFIDIDNDGEQELIVAYNATTDDGGVTYNHFGLYIYDDGVFTHINDVTPWDPYWDTDDLDEDGVNPEWRWINGGWATWGNYLVVDYGDNPDWGGLYLYNAATGWQRLNNVDPRIHGAMDIDNDGDDELLVSFIGHGTYIYDGAWKYLTTCGEFDRFFKYRDKLLYTNWRGVFIWDFVAGTPPMHINSVPPNDIDILDIDNDGQDEIVFDFGARLEDDGTWTHYGVYIYDDAGYMHINSVSPSAISTMGYTWQWGWQFAWGNRMVFNYGEDPDWGGVYLYDVANGWQRINVIPASDMGTADLNNDGVDELVLAFATVAADMVTPYDWGIYTYDQNGAYRHLGGTSPWMLWTQ